MASLECGFLSAPLLYVGRSSTTYTPCAHWQCHAAASVGSSVAKVLDCPAEIRTSRYLRERFPFRSSGWMHFSRWNASRNLNQGIRGSSCFVVPLAFQRDGPIFLISDGPIELPPTEIDIDPFAIPEASPAQIVGSVILTAAIVVLLYRSLVRRASRAKEMQFRSSGVTTTKDQIEQVPIDNPTKATELPTVHPSPAQTVIGAIVAGVIAAGLYKFTAGVEAGFLDKAVSRDYSIRNLTVTVRTIIVGSLYLATFVFAANAVGLTLYSVQLLLGLIPPDPQPSESLQEQESIPESGSTQIIEAEDVNEK